MKNKKVILSFLGFCLLSSIPAYQLQIHAGIPQLLTLSVLILLAIAGGVSKMHKPQNGMHIVQNGVEKEIWIDAIVQRFFKDNQFLKKFKNHDEYVLAGKIVHIPQRGARPTVVKNRTTYPMVAVRRTDSDLTYLLDEYSTDAIHIANAEKIELSYDKIMDVIGEHIGVVSEDAATDAIVKILALLPGAGVINTTGASTAVGVVGQTGTRAAMVHKDLKKAQLAMNVQNVTKTDRYALLESNMLDQFTDSLSDTQSRQFSEYYDAKEGVVGRLYGFDIMERSTVASAATALNGSSQLVVGALGAAVAATDDIVSMVWQKDCVAHALGEVNIFENIDDATYQGDVYSALLRNGARRMRSDNAGIIAIKQGHA